MPLRGRTTTCPVCRDRGFSSLAAKLRCYREWKGPTQVALAYDVQVDHMTVSDWENGRMRPSKVNLLGIARYYKTTPERIVNLRWCDACQRSWPSRRARWWVEFLAATLALVVISWLSHRPAAVPGWISGRGANASVDPWLLTAARRVVDDHYGVALADLLGLSFVLVVGGAFGGWIWGLLWRNKLGGKGKEPHGLDAVLWAFLTNLVNFLVLYAAAGYLRGEANLWSLVASLAGTCLGALLFYDSHWGDRRGIRDWIGDRWSFRRRENLLVVAWSILVGTLTFVPSACWGGLTAWRLASWGIRVLTCAIITSSPVMMFVRFYDRQKHDEARGIVAGVALRLGLALGLFMNG